MISILNNAWKDWRHGMHGRVLETVLVSPNEILGDLWSVKWHMLLYRTLKMDNATGEAECARGGEGAGERRTIQKNLIGNFPYEQFSGDLHLLYLWFFDKEFYFISDVWFWKLVCYCQFNEVEGVSYGLSYCRFQLIYGGKFREHPLVNLEEAAE